MATLLQRSAASDETNMRHREHRTQAMNREAAPARLVALIQLAAQRPKKRRPTKSRPAAKEKSFESKRQRSEVKSLRCGDD